MKPLTLSRDSSCAMSVDSAYGGRWLSPFVDSGKKIMTSKFWTGFSNLFNTTILSTDDFTVEFDFQLASSFVFDSGSYILNGPVSLLFSQTGEFAFNFSCLARSDGASFTPVFTNLRPTAGKSYKIKLVYKANNVIEVYVGDSLFDTFQIGSTSGIVTGTFSQTLANSRFNGYFNAFVLQKNSATVWQAQPSDLYDSLRVFPLSPQNYSKTMKDWADIQSKFNTQILYTDDWEFEIEFNWNQSQPTLTQSASIIGSRYSSPFSIEVETDGAVNLFHTGYADTGGTTNYKRLRIKYSGGLAKGKHLIKFVYSYSTSTSTVFLDGIQKSSVSQEISGVARGAFAGGLIPSQFDGDIVFMKITKNTGNKSEAVYSYGSFEERTQLINKYNVEQRANSFHRATNSDSFNIKTNLNMQGYNGDFTFIAKSFIPKNTENTKRNLFLFLQSQLFELCVQTKVNLNLFKIMIANASNDQITMGYVIPTNFDWGKEHVYSATYNSATTTLSLYIDGFLVQSLTQAVYFYNFQLIDSFVRFFSARSTPIDVNPTLSHAMVFSKCLPESMLQSITHSLMFGNYESPVELLCTTPTNLTSNTSNTDWECYSEPISTGTDASPATAWMAAAGFTGYQTNVSGGRWSALKGEALTGTSAGVRFVWKRTDLKSWAVKRVIIGNNWVSVFPSHIENFKLQGSDDGVTWADIGQPQNFGQATNTVYTEKTFDYLSNTAKYKYWCLLCNYDLTWTDVAFVKLSASANRITFINII